LQGCGNRTLPAGKTTEKIKRAKIRLKFDPIGGVERHFRPKNADLASIKTAHPSKRGKKAAKNDGKMTKKRGFCAKTTKNCRILYDFFAL